MTSNNIPRVTQQIFTGNAPVTSLAVFGTMKTGNPVYTNNVNTLTGSSAYGEGFQEAIQEDKAPYLEETNALFYGITSQLAYLFQKGIPEWDAGTTYYTTSFCQYEGDIYKSTIDNNINNIPSATSENWKNILTGNNGGGSGGSASPLALFDYEYSEYGIFNESWVIGGTTLTALNYPNAYNGLVIEMNPLYSVGQTVNNYTKRGLPVVSSTAGGRSPNNFVVNMQNQTFTLPTATKLRLLSGGTAPVRGNGMTIGLWDGTNNLGAGIEWYVPWPPGSYYLTGQKGLYGKAAGVTAPVGEQTTNRVSMGITTDPLKSGMVADLSAVTSSIDAKLYFYVGTKIIQG